MCGITGFWELNGRRSEGPLSKIAEAMADRIQSRGPDGSGTMCDESVGLAFGHRRLSIIDLSATGRQPMVSGSGRFVITYNGELYNADELREELRRSGVSFKGTSDTEVILEACEAWGIQPALKRFIGMFAFGLWDRKKRMLTCVRDRLGIKPLYWGFHKGVFFFGSQLKSFGGHPAWSGEVNPDALVSYFRFNYVPAPLSIFKGIQKLRPGGILTLDERGAPIETSYWKMEDVVTKGRNASLKAQNPKEKIQELDHLLRDAVKRRMVADVPLGAFLSGGIDSSVVVALMQAQSTKPVKTFSIGFSEAEYNEAEHAKGVAEHLGTDHTELYLSGKEALDIIPNLRDWYDEPFADSSQIPTYLVSCLARDHVTVSLSGDGGDELFAGYNRYIFAKSVWGKVGLLPLPLRKQMGRLIQQFSPQQWDRFAKIFPGTTNHPAFGDKMHKLSSVLASTTPADFYRIVVSLWENPQELVQGGEESLPWPKGISDLSITEQTQYLDTITYLPDDILTKVDRASMAVGLEARVPLLDHRVVEFAWSVPLEMKLSQGQSKWLLRQVLDQYVPKVLIDRPKMGFGVPIDHWLRGPLRDWAESLLSKKRLEEGGLNPDPILNRWEEHLSGTKNWQHSLWSALMFQSWRENLSN